MSATTTLAPLPAAHRVAIAPVFGAYAERILRATGIRRGLCLDAGCGGGYLGMALAAITELRFVFLEQSPSLLSLVDRNLKTHQLGDRSQTQLSSLSSMPLERESVDLVISRGSAPFWQDLPGVFREFRRVLRPGGQGCLWASSASRPAWGCGSRAPEALARHLWEAGFRCFEISQDEVGAWTRFTRT
nr:class I SAM-dependent methyltransferase [uncultured Holophaga sp.]